MLDDQRQPSKRRRHAPMSARAFDDFMRAFEAFKETNDERLADSSGASAADAADRPRSSPASTARSTSTSASSTSWRSRPRARSSAAARAARRRSREHKAAFDGYVRNGEAGSLRDLEAQSALRRLRSGRRLPRARRDRARRQPRA